jgi:hypothetical protein
MEKGKWKVFAKGKASLLQKQQLLVLQKKGSIWSENAKLLLFTSVHIILK